ncbi:SLBB domain-containing protein [Leptolyngbya sp. FACHB-17]|uniref:SLBB domain-containing protein n=1 Tax=unclassified Leptolyngbya TaxID=2650499 RepID=UPI0016818588|nr:SLBB domain-containing protein [Leptolyngbya sp. FACHB-17]MBD2081879.1 SLBB domain-containing protein [Leptolyngbya sp. FACHB-17]
MKLKLSPTRVSLLALGAFAAVVAQELARSDAKTPSATPPNKSNAKQNSASPAASLPDRVALSQPENLFSALPTIANPAAIAKPTVSANQPIVPPPPPTVAASLPNLAVTDVNQLPIDTIIEQTLKLPPPPPKVAVSPDQSAPKAPTSAAKDVQGHRAQPSITAMMQQGIMKGYSDGTFRPDAPITDAQFKSITKQAATKSSAIASLKRPKDIVTRADAATYIHRQLLRASTIEKSQTLAQAPTSAPLPKLDSVSPAQLVNDAPASRPLPPAAPPTFAVSSGIDEADADSYTLGAGDRIRVDIFNVPEYSKEYQVLVNGTLNLHRVGSIPVAGLTIRQAQSAIAARYSRLLKSPTVDASLMSARPLNVAIAGEVGKPGTYTLSFGEGGKFPTVTKLIRDAGGMNRSADARQVIVRRNGSQEIRLNMWELFTTGNIRQDLSLRDGDSIFIPAANSVNLAEVAQMADANFSVSATQPVNVAVVGEVARPGPYIIKDQTPTLSSAIREAGGIKQLANLKEVKVRRNTRSGAPQTISVDLWQLLKSGDLKQDLVLQQGDTIEIPTALALNSEEARQLGDASFAPRSVKITVVGEVEKPGQVEVPMNTPLNQALLAAGGFTRQANRRRVELVRLNPNGSVSRQNVSIDLSRGIDEKGNPLLKDGDVLVIDRNGLAKTGDTLNNVLGPVLQVLPFRFLFGL